MYPQFAENPAMRGLPDMARSRLPYPPYYTPKLPEGMPYVGGQRPSLPYGGGKPIPPHDPMYGPWNTMMMSQGMMSVPKQMNKPEYGFPGQTDIYGRPYPPDPMMGGGYPTHGYPSSYSPYQTYPPHLGIPSHMGDGYTPERPSYQPQNNVWNTETGPVNSPSRTWPTQQQQQQEMMTSSEMPRPPSAFQGSPQPAALSSDLQKGSSMTSLKDALVNPPCTLPDSNKYQFNSSYLSVGGDARDHTSPHTPSNARTPDPITPGRSGLLGNNNGMSPLSSTNNDNNIASRPSQTSPFEVEAILGIKESTENGESFINSKTIKSISPTSPAGSPHTKKVRSPIFSPVNRHHQSFSSQYNLSDEPGRRDFLDALFKYMEQEGIPFLRPPTMNKNTLDLFKTFTAVQSLGGFTHVVNKRLWKDVAKSSNNSSSSTSSVLLKTLSEYYVKVLLPYECHFTRTNIQDCLSHYELSHRVGGDNVVPNDDSVSDILADNLQDDRKSTTSLSQDLTLLDNNNTNQDNLLVFSEDSQGSLEGFSNQPLPDISVQEAESVLGISTTSAGPTTPSPSYPSYHRGTPEWPANSPDPSRDMMPPYQASPPTGNYPPYFDYGHYSRRQYMSRGYPNMEDSSTYSYPPHLPNMMGRVEDYQSFNHPSMNTGEWSSWPHPQMQVRPRLPPPLPPHLQSMMFTPPSQSPHPPLPSSPVLPPQHIDNTSQALDPIKIMVNEQGLPPDKSTPPPPLPSKPVVNQDMKVADKVTDKATPPLSAPIKQELPVIPVETIQPQLVKRRRLNCDHCGHVEPWRVMMSLKCGLPAESTWALDTLSILLHDDRTVGFFYLKHHHSLLNTLVDHFTNCLVDIFGAPFEMLAKYDTPDDEVLPGSDRPVPLASIYHHTDKDIRLGYSDHVCHVVTSTPLIDVIPVREPVAHPLTRQKCSNTQQIDETSLLELLKRDALTERILLHMKTPRRLMARSPIQKYFLSPPSSNEIVDDESVLVTSPKQSQYKHTHQENEVIKEEPLPLWTIPSQLEALQKRTLCISNILRSLSFIPGNDMEFSQHPGLLTILGHLLLLHHVHLQSKDRQYTNYKDDEVAPPTIQEDYWWWSCLEVLRENVFVILANIAGQLDLSVYPEVISYPLINGLLHWLVCPSSLATDPLPDTAMVYSLSPQRLVVEALAKMSISEINVDYILATPPLPRLDLVYSTLLHFISQKKHPAVRQFALVFLSNLAQGGEGASRMIGQQKMTLPLLLECIESSVNASPPTTTTSKSRTYLHYTDDLSSLSLAMLRRAVITLHCLAKVPINRVSFLPYCNRLLALSMSDVLDPSLTSTLSDVLYELSRLL